MATPSILLVDDHPLFCDGFGWMLRALRPTWRLECASSALEARSLIVRSLPGLVIIDVTLPGDDGFALLAQVAKEAPMLPQLLISGREDEAVRVRARACGARGFICKTSSPEFIVAAMDRVLCGDTGFEPARLSDNMPVLTVRQAEVLGLLALGHGNKEIRYQLNIAERTVRAHLTELFHLLDAHSRAQAVIRARALGLVP